MCFAQVMNRSAYVDIECMGTFSPPGKRIMYRGFILHVGILLTIKILYGNGVNQQPSVARLAKPAVSECTRKCCFSESNCSSRGRSVDRNSFTHREAACLHVPFAPSPLHQAAKTAIIIAKQEQDLGNYKVTNVCRSFLPRNDGYSVHAVELRSLPIWAI